MSSIALGRGDVVVGVDTHRDEHVAVALDGLGGLLDELAIAAKPDGYAQLLAWADEHGAVAAFGVQRHRLLWQRPGPLPASPRPQGRRVIRPPRKGERPSAAVTRGQPPGHGNPSAQVLNLDPPQTMKTCYRLRVAARPIWRFVGPSMLMAPQHAFERGARARRARRRRREYQIGLAGPRHDEGRADDRDVVSPWVLEAGLEGARDRA